MIKVKNGKSRLTLFSKRDVAKKLGWTAAQLQEALLSGRFPTPFHHASTGEVYWTEASVDLYKLGQAKKLLRESKSDPLSQADIDRFVSGLNKALGTEPTLAPPTDTNRKPTAPAIPVGGTLNVDTFTSGLQESL